MHQTRKIQSYLYEFLNYKYLDTSQIHEFKQSFLQAIKEKKSKQDIRNVVNQYFNSENILNFLNEDGKHLFSFVDVEEYNKLLDLIKKFEKKADIVFRYYQYLAIFYSFLIFKIIQNTEIQNKFLEEYKKYLESYDINLAIEKFDLRRLNYWMATGSGKTYLMYFMFELYLNLFKNINNIYLVVPAGLIYQHKQNLKNIYGIDLQGETTSGIIDINGKKINFTVLSINILTNRYKEKEFNPQMGETIFVFDEGHKGAGGDGKTEELKNKIVETEDQFLFDWSATFQEVFKGELNEKKKTKNPTLNKYFTSSIYNYNLTIFQSDGFGKKIHYRFGNISEGQETPTKINLKNAMESFFKQVDEYNRNVEKYSKEGIKFYKPLFLAVSNEIGTSKKTDQEQKNNLIEVVTSFIQLAKNDFNNRFNINGKVQLEVGKEEILIKMGKINGLIYVGTTGIKKIVEEFKKEKFKYLVNIAENLSEEIFKKLDKRGDVLFLFGSKKFIEGWDSKRPSTIFLLKGAKTSTIQAVQLLGRGLRIDGYNGDGFRHLSYEKNKEVELEKLYLFGQDVDALKDFLEKSIDTTIKIVKIYWTKPLLNLDKLRLPYLKYIEEENDEIIVIKLSKENITNVQNTILISVNGKNIKINCSYKKIATITEDGDKYKTSKNTINFKIPYLVLKQEVRDIINELNHKNNGIFLIEEGFFIKLFNYLDFEENIGLTRQQKKEFVLQVVKGILNKIYRKLNKKISYEIDYIKSNDEDIKFKYEVIIKTNKKVNAENTIEILGLKLKNDKKYETVIEIREEEDLKKYFEIENKKEDEKEIKEKIRFLEKDMENIKSEVGKKALMKEIENEKERLKELKLGLIGRILDRFKAKVKDIPHIYHRIYHLYGRDSNSVEHKYGNLTVKVSGINSITEKDIELNPVNALKLNNLEAQVIKELVDQLKKHYKDIYIFRNPSSGNKCFEYEYEGLIHKFYPDFILWLIDNNGEKTILFLEPKGEQDKSFEEKAQVFYRLNNNFTDNHFEKIISSFKGFKVFFKDEGKEEKLDISNLNLKKDNIKAVFGILISK